MANARTSTSGIGVSHWSDRPGLVIVPAGVGSLGSRKPQEGGDMAHDPRLMTCTHAMADTEPGLRLHSSRR